jgi:hypothetical protein
MNGNSKELVIKDTDSVIEYKPSTEIKKPEFKNPKEKKLNKRLALYHKLISSQEFQKPESTSIVLDEDDYLNNLENIIKRDYFPHLYEKDNIHKDQLSPTYDRLEKINKEYFSNKTEGKNQIDIDKLNIDTYCMNYTSDELESLKDILYDDKRKKLKKIFWMYEQEHNANERLLALREYCDDYLKILDVSIL